VVNETDLLHALDQGLIAGAGLDVFATEPPKPDHPLLLRENVIATPHIAGVTYQCQTAVAKAMADNIIRFKQGQPVKNCVNPEVLRG
jgi:phosphoglycerate dehydrogenase-like enzyme